MIRFLQTHPAVRDALCWALPAMLVGSLLRALLLHSLPYAFWGADSRSYYSFAHQLIVRHVVTLDEKRRYFYPILMLPVTLLPGSPLRWLALLQHTLGVVSLAPLAYIVRKTTAHWRLWIVPITVVYAVLPVVVWYEHELLGENVFFAALLWTFAGWSAWVGERRTERAARLFWCFFVPLAVFFLTKPSGRFVWPGLVGGMALTGMWRSLHRRHMVALALLAIATLTVGSRKQGAWLLYTATFPMTQLQTPLHADYKAEIADMVTARDRRLDSYYREDDEVFEFLERPGSQTSRPLWRNLESDPKTKSRLYMDLAIEGVKARPGAFIWLGIQRLVASANLSEFRLDRFSGDYYRKRTEHFYADAERTETSPVRLAYGLPRREPLPSYAEFETRLEPEPDSTSIQLLRAVLDRTGKSLDLIRMPQGLKAERAITLARPTVLGWWLLGAIVLAWAAPSLRRSYGVWALIACSYLVGVFAVSQHNPRYFAAAWPILIPLLAAPADLIVRTAVRWFPPFRAAEVQRGRVNASADPVIAVDR